MFLSTHNEVCLWWLEGTLQRLRSEGQKRVVPIGSLLSVMVILLFSGLALAQLLLKSVNTYTKTVPKRKR
jgi:hypothetical protein